jgi:hypothetical protein
MSLISAINHPMHGLIQSHKTVPLSFYIGGRNPGFPPGGRPPVCPPGGGFPPGGNFPPGGGCPPGGGYAGISVCKDFECFFLLARSDMLKNYADYCAYYTNF